MAKKSLNLIGTTGKEYDLDEIQSESRLNSERKLLVQVHKYKKGENPNPENLQVGQIWISKMIDE